MIMDDVEWLIQAFSALGRSLQSALARWHLDPRE